MDALAVTSENRYSITPETTAHPDLCAQIQAYAEKGDWTQIEAALTYYSHDRIDAIMVNCKKGTTTLKVSLLWLTASVGKWGLIEKMLKFNPKSEVDFSPEGYNAGRSILWLVANGKKWKLFDTILKNYPHVSLEATAMAGDSKGKNILYHVVYNRKWRRAQKIVEQNPNINLGEGRYSIIRRVVRYGDEFFLYFLLEKGFNIDSDKKNHDDLIYHLACRKNWELIAKLMHKPLNTKLLTGTPEGISLLKMAADTQTKYIYYCSRLLYSIQMPPFVSNNMTFLNDHFESEIKCVFERAMAVFHQSKYNLFIKFLPIDLQHKCLVDVIKSDCPNISSLPSHVILSILEEKMKAKSTVKSNVFEEIEYNSIQDESKDIIVTLAFKEFRQNNGLSFHNFSATTIDDFKDMIYTTLDAHNVFYRKPIRDRIIVEIGKERPNPLNINRRHIEEAIGVAIAAVQLEA